MMNLCIASYAEEVSVLILHSIQRRYGNIHSKGVCELSMGMKNVTGSGLDRTSTADGVSDSLCHSKGCSNSRIT